MDKQIEKMYAEEDQQNENDSTLNIGDNIWGTCHRGDRCEFRHPSYRYLERPKRTTPGLLQNLSQYRKNQARETQDLTQPS